MIRVSERSARGDPHYRRTGARGRAAGWLGALLAILLPVGALLYAPAGIAATPADTAATHALLQARYELDVAFLHDAPAVQASADRLVAVLGRECHDVLARAPKDRLEPSEAPTPRASGERERGNLQQQTLGEELLQALNAAHAEPNRSALESYAAAIASLSWSDARIAPLVHAEAAPLQESLTIPPPDVCADMKAWVQSGYRLLSLASRAFRAARAAREEQPEAGASLDALLKPSEGAAELALFAVREQSTRSLAPRSSGSSRTTGACSERSGREKP